MNNHFQEKLQSDAGLRTPKFNFTFSNDLEKLINRLEKKILFAFETPRKKLIKAIKKHWPYSNKKLSKQEVKLAEEDDVVQLIISGVSGRELSAALVEGQKQTWLMGYREIAEGLGRKNGDEGVEGVFDFNSLPEDAMEAAKQAGVLISENTLNTMMHGISGQEAQRAMESILYSGLNNRLTSSEMAKNISNAFQEMAAWKAAEITRSELPRAYNYGRISAAQNDGLTKARIILGGKPCSWCETNAPYVQTLEDANLYMEVHHPNNDCTVVPIIDYDYYGLPEPEFWPEGVDTEGKIQIPERFQKAVGTSGIKFGKKPELKSTVKPRPKAKPIAKPKVVKPVVPAPVVPSPVIPAPTPEKAAAETLVDRTARVSVNKYKDVVNSIDEILPAKRTAEFDAWLEKTFNCSLKQGKDEYVREELKEILTGFSKVYGQIDDKLLASLMETKTKDDIAGWFELRMRKATGIKKINELGIYGRSGYAHPFYKDKLAKVLDRWIGFNPKDSFTNAVEDRFNGLGMINTRVRTAAHEISHHVWFKGMSSEVQKEYYQKIYKELFDKSITTYSRTKVEEHFAEHAAMFVDSPEILKKYNKDAYDWLKKNVFTKE